MKKKCKSLTMSRETLLLLEGGELRGARGQLSGPCTTTALTSCQQNSYHPNCFSDLVACV
jgi:hypothetical protein